VEQDRSYAERMGIIQSTTQRHCLASGTSGEKAEKTFSGKVLETLY